jgi:hypothetical protein
MALYDAMRAECGKHWVSRVKVFVDKAAAFVVAEQIVSSSLTNAGTP